jgi:hypothetical protein
MKMIIILIALISIPAVGQVCYDENNDVIKVPPGYKIIAVPWWWPLDQTFVHLGGAVHVTVPQPVAADPCEGLTVSPSECEE